MKKTIRPMTKEERERAKEREQANNWKECVSCKGPAQSDFCGFCLEEE